jgi:polar amino acid transport system substrate-binding protein
MRAISKCSTSAVLAAVVPLLLGVAAAARADTVALRADEWCPYNCAPDHDKPGYAVELAREAFAAAGHTVDYQVLGWSRSIEDARAGRYAGIIGAIPDDAPDFIFPSEPIGASMEGYAVRKGTAFRYRDAESFAGKVLGSIAGYAFGGAVGEYIEAHKDDRSRVQLVSGDDALAQNLRKLVAGRVDVVVDDANVLANAIAELDLGEQVVVADAGKPGPIYIAFSPALPKGKENAAILDRGIAALRRSGRLDLILARYGLKDWR